VVWYTGYAGRRVGAVAVMVRCGGVGGFFVVAGIQGFWRWLVALSVLALSFLTLIWLVRAWA
jgi:hypothetical protein